MIYPDIEQLKKNIEGYKVHPIFYEIMSDSFTPIHIFKALQRGEENAFILESVSNGEQWGKYSFIGINPLMESLSIRATPIHSAKAEQRPKKLPIR